MYLLLKAPWWLAGLVHAVQPSAPAPIRAPLRDLPWGQLNILHTTDTHGWFAGHLQEASYQADWGDYISFATHLKQQAADRGVDVLVVDTGDRVEGSGLYDSSIPPGKYTYDIVKKQSMDVICCGNHELYHAHTATREFTINAKNFKESYLASNVDIIDPNSGSRVPLAARYRLFETPNLKLKVLAFGFLFDFTGNANNSFVIPMKTAVQEQWFQDAIREECDIILVIGHVPVRQSEFDTLYSAIRQVKWDTPIQFMGGHTHIRDYVKYGPNAYGLESGRFMETIGWASIKGLSTKESVEGRAQSLTFDRKYIDNNIFSYHHHTGLNESTFPTNAGTNVSKMITSARKELDLSIKVGCSPQDYWISRAPYPSNNSILSLLSSTILPSIAPDESRSKIPRIFLMNSGAIRFDIFKGAVTRDSVYSVSPFAGGMGVIKDVPYDKAKRVLEILNKAKNMLGSNHLATRNTDGVDNSLSHLVAFGNRPSSQSVLSWTEDKELPPGYTTSDDLGNQGDDTVHEKIQYYDVPNCIQGRAAFPKDGVEPEKVDVVFVSFIEDWILRALLLTGQEYGKDEVTPFKPGTSFTDAFGSWIQANWKVDSAGSC
ncbi:MAG: hypothetical protein M1814_003416 [Vezdaea aestivalis]|nr:MAG: hypothetical protein M1814_003416 [Vezdaea aestivalis]